MLRDEKRFSCERGAKRAVFVSLLFLFIFYFSCTVFQISLHHVHNKWLWIDYVAHTLNNKYDVMDVVWFQVCSMMMHNDEGVLYNVNNEIYNVIIH